MSGTGAELGELTYLYVGVDDVGQAVAFYQAAFGATLVWRFQAFATEVAAMRINEPGPLVLLAEHRPAPSCLPIWTVADLDTARARLGTSGFAGDGQTVGTPDGPVHVFHDPDGNSLGLLQADRPGALETAYADPGNTNAIH
jgi:predicted enzyme related to lactoylglutathione lyase